MWKHPIEGDVEISGPFEAVKKLSIGLISCSRVAT
jgi:hypothetical protein